MFQESKLEIAFLVLLVIILVFVFVIFLRTFNNNLINQLAESDKKVVLLENLIRTEFTQNRSEMSNNFKDLRLEINQNIGKFGETLNSSISYISTQQKNQLDSFSNQLFNLTKTNEDKFIVITDTLENRLKSLQEDNNLKLEKMRETVDEKLHLTLEKRLGESFKIVSERLELVHKGLGEMQNLAAGVGDIKKVLSNVKTKGVLGEYQLGNILDQLLTPEQYSRNVKTKPGSDQMVEFAVKLPGRDKNLKELWLPIDSKFPTEDYQMLLDAFESGNAEAVIESKKILVKKIKDSAKSISEKYIDPPNTTDFGILFLPFEGLFAEVINNPGLFETVQREYKIVITGPTTLSALLNSLQMGFKTLAIEKRSGEVWELLSSVKTEFGNFALILDNTKKKLEQATESIDKASVRSRAIERRLKNVQELPSAENASGLIES
ncbi:MAG: DNA recombination protein RmuC [Bacteroidetes bacterium]|nr:DNA recombination protein RmuC [Bacteroidota bacterium]